MNLIERIESTLRANKDLVITHSYHSLQYPDKSLCEYGPWQSYGFYIAPKKPIFDPRELNAFMNNLLPFAHPSHTHDFAIREKSKVVFLGSLIYDEVIGNRTFCTNIELTDMYGMEDRVKANGTSFDWVKEIERSIAVWGSPSAAISRERARGKYKPLSTMTLDEFLSFIAEEESLQNR